MPRQYLETNHYFLILSPYLLAIYDRLPVSFDSVKPLHPELLFPCTFSALWFQQLVSSCEVYTPHFKIIEHISLVANVAAKFLFMCVLRLHLCNILLCVWHK
jgi:hypothetical protein